MAITSIDQYLAAARQRCQIIKTATRTSVGLIPFSVQQLAGLPGAGPASVGNTANGVVPVDSDAGYPALTDFAVGASGYLGALSASNSVVSRIMLFDTLFAAGAYAFNANVTLASQPSYVSRLPAESGYNGLEIWIEAATAFTGNQTVEVLYVNQGGVDTTTGAIALGVAPTLGRMTQLPLAAGDSGVQQIKQVISTVSSAGTFNVFVLRRLWQGRISVANEVIERDILTTGMPRVFQHSALRLVVQADSTSTGLPNVAFDVVSG